MKASVIFFLICIFDFSLSQVGLSSQFIKSINNKKSTWVARQNFPNLTLKGLKQLVGTNGAHYFASYHVPILELKRTAMPKFFDTRTKWPHCQKLIGLVYDQGHCFLSWVQIPLAVMSDRLCIHTKGKKQIRLSHNDVINCCTDCQLKRMCDSGWTIQVWSHWIEKGIVSGGPTGCQPASNRTTTCQPKCTNRKFSRPYQKDKHFGVVRYRTARKLDQIKLELMAHGPVTAQMQVYRDFFAYEKGVYQHLQGELVGYIVVKIIGWGQEKSVPYWLCSTPFGSKWGALMGFFKIVQGMNQCLIETEVVSGGFHRYFREMTSRSRLSLADKLNAHRVLLLIMSTVLNMLLISLNI